MKLIKIFIFTLCIFGIQRSWGSSSSSYQMSAGSKIADFLALDTEWVDFCIDKKLGCARFKVNMNEEKPIYGFLKVMTDRAPENKFKEYCKNAYTQTLNLDNKVTSYTVQTREDMSYCSWSSSFDKTFFFWKSGLTLMVTVSDRMDLNTLITMISRASIYDKK